MYKGISQYEITHMENLMARDDYWNDDYDDVRTICDITDNCSDCPRMGDDCDGRDDEEDDDDDRIAYYERQGDEYVYYDEDEHELFREPV